MNYNYYRGLIYTGLEDYTKAKHCFQLVLDTPYPNLHILQVMAFKKLLLLIWLTSTHDPNDSDHTGVKLAIKQVLSSKGMMGRHLDQTCQAYIKADSINNFFIMGHEDEIVKDGNMGLVKLVIKKLRNEVLESLSQTNTMLGINEISDRLKTHREFCDLKEEEEKNNVLRKLKDKFMEDSEKELSYDDEDVHTVLLKMIKKGKLHAKIDTKKTISSSSEGSSNNVVVFEEDESITTQQLSQKLEKQSMEIIEILKEVENTDMELILQKKAGVVEANDFMEEERDPWMMEEMM